MDVEFVLNGISFVWDDAKADSNLRKHGVSFEQATEAFFDPFVRVTDASVEEEVRDAVIGRDEGSQLLFVVHIEFKSGRYRLVSARRATPPERRFYES